MFKPVRDIIAERIVESKLGSDPGVVLCEPDALGAQRDPIDGEVDDEVVRSPFTRHALSTRGQ